VYHPFHWSWRMKSGLAKSTALIGRPVQLSGICSEVATLRNREIAERHKRGYKAEL